jgi:hypothetical protein
MSLQFMKERQREGTRATARREVLARNCGIVVVDLIHRLEVRGHLNSSHRLHERIAHTGRNIRTGEPEHHHTTTSKNTVSSCLSLVRGMVRVWRTLRSFRPAF